MLPVSEVAGSGGGSSSSPGPVGFAADASLIGAGGLLKSLDHSNGLGLWRTYDNDNILGQLGVYDLAIQPPAPRLLRFHSLTNNMSLTNIWDDLVPSENQSFWLNGAGRLQNADGPWGQDIYQHDGVGNRTQFARTFAGTTTTRIFGYPANNNRLALTTIGGVTERSFTHDAAGNMTGDNRGAGGNFTYAINRTGRIAASSKSGVAQGANTYDAFERLRVRTLTNQTPANLNGTTHYVWDILGNIIAEMDGMTGATLRETVYVEDMPLAAIDAAALPKKTYAIHVDHLNRPIMMTDAAKATVWAASYEPFGKVMTLTGTATQNLGLPGQWFQLETGLAYNWHRHYDPTTGRYTTPDPLGFVDGPSVFEYAGSNPLVMTDKEGLFAPVIVGAGAAAAYVFTPSIANAPGPKDQIFQNNDMQPFENAGMVAATGASVCTVRTVLNPWSSIYAPGSWLNSGQHFRIGRGRDRGRTTFRASGDFVEKTTGKKHVDFKDLGRWSK